MLKYAIAHLQNDIFYIISGFYAYEYAKEKRMGSNQSIKHVIKTALPLYIMTSRT